jgi:hypothetical protein
MAWASAALNREQGSITAFGDCGCVSLLAEEEVGEGAAGLLPPLVEDGPLQETNRHEQSIALKHRPCFIGASVDKFEIVNYFDCGFFAVSHTARLRCVLAKTQ